MNDLSNFVNPKNKDAKCWGYDISNGFKFYGPKKLNTPIGGKSVDIILDKNYEFEWKNISEFWFLDLEGK